MSELPTDAIDACLEHCWIGWVMNGGIGAYPPILQMDALKAEIARLQPKQGDKHE